MKNLDLFNEISLLGNNPYNLNELYPGATQKQELRFSPRYNIEIPLFTNFLWQKRLVSLFHIAVSCLNDFHANWTKFPESRAYLVHQHLDKHLMHVIYTFQEAPTGKTLSLINNKAALKKPEKVQLIWMKHLLVWIYAEINNLAAELDLAQQRSLKTLYQSLFLVSPPKQALITKNKTRKVPKPTIRTEKPSPRTPPGFDQFVKIPERFIRIESQLIEYDLIHKDKTFIPTYGNRQLLAAVYWQLIDKGYFYEFLFPDKIKIKPTHIRKFLDNRYSVNLRKQFQYWEKDCEGLKKFIYRLYWLDQIPHCH